MTTAEGAREDGRLGKLEGVVESLVREFAEIRADLRGLRVEVRALNTKIDRQFYRLIGVIVTMWVALIIALLLKG